MNLRWICVTQYELLIYEPFIHPSAIDVRHLYINWRQSSYQYIPFTFVFFIFWKYFFLIFAFIYWTQLGWYFVWSPQILFSFICFKSLSCKTKIRKWFSLEEMEVHAFECLELLNVKKRLLRYDKLVYNWFQAVIIFC